MNPVKELKTTWQSIPVEVQQFLKRALLIFILWKLVYHLFLFNGRILDKPLTDWSTKGAAQIMQLFYPNSRLLVKEECGVSPELNNEIACWDFLLMDKKKIVGVGDACNALELYVLYIGFLFAFSSSVKRILLFSIAGIVLIYLANIIRLAALASMNMHRMDAVDMAHHYVFKVIVYALIFGLWVLFTKKQLNHEKNA
jgi:exosortase family protein XrtF